MLCVYERITLLFNFTGSTPAENGRLRVTLFYHRAPQAGRHDGLADVVCALRTWPSVCRAAVAFSVAVPGFNEPVILWPLRVGTELRPLL